MDAIRQFRNLMGEVDRLFQVCAIGGFSRGVDKVEVFDNLIEKISNFDVTAIEDELTADASKLKDNLQTARLILRNAPKSLNQDKLFPEYSELDSIYEKIKKIDGEEWASRVVGGLAGVTSHANSLLADISKIIDELAKYDKGEKPSKAEAKEQSQQYKRKMNEDELRKCFRIAFRGGGNGNIDYFKDNLLPDLKQNWSDKDLAKIALMIYNSGKLMPAMRPNTFRAWYKEFCNLIGCKYHKDYKPSILEPDDKLQRVFYYL